MKDYVEQKQRDLIPDEVAEVTVDLLDASPHSEQIRVNLRKPKTNDWHFCCCC